MQWRQFTESWLVRTYKNHTIMLVIMMSPSISNAQPTMATICGRKRRKVQHQETKGQTKMHLKGHELLRVLKIELPHELLRELIQRAELPPVTNRNCTTCFFILKKHAVRQRKKVITSRITSSQDCGCDYKDEITPIIG